MEYLRENPPDILTTSYFSSRDFDVYREEFYKELYNKGCFMCLAAGNENSEIEELAFVDVKPDVDMWKAIGACNYSVIKKSASRQLKYAVGEELDYMSLHRLVATWDKKEHAGTSFAAPLFAGTVALVQGYFLQHTGKKLPQDKLNEFIKDNCIDLEEEGRDNKTGCGLFVLPEPTEINISKYCEDYESEAEEMIRYNTLEETPEWGKLTIEKLIKKGALKGDETGLNMTEDLLRTLVIHDRLGLYDLTI